MSENEVAGINTNGVGHLVGSRLGQPLLNGVKEAATNKEGLQEYAQLIKNIKKELEPKGVIT